MSEYHFTIKVEFETQFRLLLNRVVANGFSYSFLIVSTPTVTIFVATFAGDLFPGHMTFFLITLEKKVL